MAPRIINPIARAYLLINTMARMGDRSDADPLRLRWVDPGSPIFDCLPDEPQLPPNGQVLGGVWDIDTPRFKDRPVPRSIKAHFSDGTPWAETQLADHIEEQLSQFFDAWSYRENTFDRRCEEMEALYDRMKTEGYRTQADLAMGERTGPGPPAAPQFGEITVDIGPNGELGWRGNGQHRLAIARLLPIEQVSVLVAVDI